MYSHLVLGGTFDHFHIGHKHLLSKAVTLSTHITIGLTTEVLHTKKEYVHAIEEYHIREKNIREFLSSLGDVECTVIPIDSMYGTTTIDPTFDCILVTPQTRSNAEIISTERQKLGLSRLIIEECSLRTDSDGQIISSTRIRKGEIDRNGTVYETVFANTLHIDEEIKKVLRVPFGEVLPQFSPISHDLPIFLIGDVTTDTFIKNNHRFTAAYIDGISQRKPYNLQIDFPYTVATTTLHNPAGAINPQTFLHMKKVGLHKNNHVYTIHGEEDLLACCALILLPLESTVVYGQAYPVSGLVYVNVTESIKKTIFDLLCKLTSID